MCLSRAAAFVFDTTLEKRDAAGLVNFGVVATRGHFTITI